MKPILKYAGGKSREIPQFLKYIPDNFDRYIEPFFGGGSLYFYLEPKNAIINDANSRLMTFYAQVKDQYPLMHSQLVSLYEQYKVNQENYYKAKKFAIPSERVSNENQETYYRMRDLFNNPDGSLLDGTLFYYINKTSYSSMIRYNKKGKFNVPFGYYKDPRLDVSMQSHSDLLQGAEIFSLDYSRIFEMARENDFMFLDPPYDCVFHDYAGKEFGEPEQRRLADDFRKLSCKALMVINKTPLTMELYGDYVCDEYDKKYYMFAGKRTSNDSKHIVVKNF